MLSYQQALKKILGHTPLLRPRILPLEECLGKVLAKNIYSQLAFPHFNNSAVDGYAARLQ